MKFCQNCGSELKEGVAFCSNCGSPINNASAAHVDGPASQSATNHPRVENRGIALWIILSIITCGICALVWFINMVNDVNTICNDEKSSQSGGMVFLLTLVTCGIYGLIWFYQAGKRMEVAGKRYNMNIADNSLIYLLLSIFGLGIVTYGLLQSDLNKYSE